MNMLTQNTWIKTAILAVIPSILPMMAMADGQKLQDDWATLPIAQEHSDTNKQTWLDYRHQKIQGWLNKNANNIDDWFGDVNGDKSATASLRVMMDSTWNQYDGTNIKPRIRGKIRLPTLQEKLSVVFGDDDLDNEPADGGSLTDDRVITPNDDGKRYNKQQIGKDNASLALRWSKFRQDTGMDVDLGVRSKDVFVRASMDKTWQMPADTQGRFEQMYRYGIKSKHTALSTLEFTKPLSERQALILRTHLLYTNKDDENVNWGSSLFLRRDWQVAKGAAELNYGLYAGGDVMDKRANLNTYGPYVGYRQPVWRDWLFVQGDVSYYNNKNTNRTHHVATFGRVEMVF